jgi:hypothetical protein
VRLFGFEHKSEPMASPAVFAGRVIGNMAFASILIVIALGVGMAGFNWLEGTSWVDGFQNAAMLLGGMGPTATPSTDAGKIFAGVYALVCGLLLVAVSGIVLAPVLHRVLHRLHVNDKAD